MLCESTGEFSSFVASSPIGDCKITSVCSYTRGFIAAGENGHIYVFEANADDLDEPFKLLTHTSYKELNNKSEASITSMVITSSEDTVYFILDKSNQLMKLSIALDGTEEPPKYEHLIYDFHSSSVTGLDVCVRKQLIATCSLDQSVRIWNYATKSLEIVDYQTDECYAVGFHPSGFHLVVALTDKILIMNIFSSRLEQFKSIPIKGCHEISFAHGGHLFAAINDKIINVYNFWTCDRPNNYQFNAHLNKVRCVHWDDDDLGFVSSGMDGAIYTWMLKDNSQRLDEYLLRSTQFLSVVKIAGTHTQYAVGTDGVIREIEQGKEKHKYDTGTPLSQVVITNKSSQRALFVGTSQKDCPG